jgi:xanthine/uracil permease
LDNKFSKFHIASHGLQHVLATHAGAILVTHIVEKALHCQQAELAYIT